MLSTLLLLPPTVFADVAQQDVLALGRVDHFCQRGQWEAAAAELGRLTPEAQGTPAVQRYLRMAFDRLYTPGEAERPRRALSSTDEGIGLPWWKQVRPRVKTMGRITHHHQDADENADQIFDERGWQYNTQWLAEQDARGWRHRVRGSLDGLQDGQNDLRLRHFSYQAHQDGIRLTAGDIRSYLTAHRVTRDEPGFSGYTLNATRLRGLDVELGTERNQFHLMAGAIPVFQSESDRYIYPRKVVGLRDSFKFTSWYRAGIGAAYALDDDERIEHVNVALQPREITVFSIEQDLVPIADHWTINAESAYSTTDDSLRPNRFGQNVTLGDAAHSVVSEWKWPVIRIIGTYERVGPDFRAPSDIGSSTINSTSVATDRETIGWRVYPRRLGRFFGHLAYSHTRHDLDDDSEVEMTREHWFTAQGGVQLPEPWPQPDARLIVTRTTSVPGSRFTAARRLVYDLSSDLRKRWADIDWTLGGIYWQAVKDEGDFDDELRRGLRLQAGRQVWPGGYANARGAWTRAHELFDNTVLRRHWEQEIGFSLGTRLWSTASFSAGYTYQDTGIPVVVNPPVQAAAGGIIETYSSNFIWPYTRFLRLGRTLRLIPSVHFYFSSASDDREFHPSVGGRLSARYDVRDTHRWEFLLEGRQDDDANVAGDRTEEWRAWLLWTSKFGPALPDESPLR